MRHRPDAVGLVLDAGGWAKADDILAALNRQGYAADWELLTRIVETNDKRRFELSADAELIRARQGHSVDVEADWRAAVPPDILWHGTVERFLPAILTEGLKAMSRRHVHLSGDRTTAEKVGRRRGKAILLLVKAKHLADEGQQFWITGNGVWLTKSVPPEALALE